MKLTQINTASEFWITRNYGVKTRVDTYPEAIALLKAEGCEEIGHSGDLEDGGNHTLAWMTSADALNDDGMKSHAEITAVYDC